MEKNRIEYFGVRRNTVLVFKRIMEYLCGVCDSKCSDVDKLTCMEFAMNKASESSDNLSIKK